MATVNLYVTDDLKTEMTEQDGLPWSRIASDAFKSAINLERTRTMISTDEASLARLRVSRDSHSEAREAEGFALGKQWAADHADYEQLKAVAALADEPDEWWEGEPSAFGWCHPLMDAINGEGEWDRQDVEGFGEKHMGREYPGASTVRGFVQGAAEVFEKV